MINWLRRIWLTFQTCEKCFYYNGLWIIKNGCDTCGYCENEKLNKECCDDCEMELARDGSDKACEFFVHRKSTNI